MRYIYHIYRPSGNDTALIKGLVKDIETKKKINSFIQKNHKNVEQVGFIDEINGKFFLEMAGGEFCANATRSTIFNFLQGKRGELHIKVSGTKQIVSGGINDYGDVWVEMPINNSLDTIHLINGYSLVEMDGITHVIVDKPDINDADELKSKAFEILCSLNLDKTVPASGVIFVTKTPQRVLIDPVVWVRDLQTLYHETACGSGTTALGLFESKNTNKSVSLSVIQPSGKTIVVEVEKAANHFVKAVMSGKVELLEKNLQIEL